MKLLNFICILVIFCVGSSVSLQLESLLPIQHDFCKVRTESEQQAKHQFTLLDFIGLVEQHGYTARQYNVTTKDGYHLRLHRISGSIFSPEAPGKRVVYLQHGIGLSSDSWVLIGPGKDLAFLLADAGYDVWIGNVRGNTYSRSHVSKDPKDADFWNFSYHEMAIYDIPAFIDRILKETRQQNLTYYGYSMGTTLSYVLLSMRPEYNEKINVLYSVAPVVFWKNELKKAVKFVDSIFEPLQAIIKYFNSHELIPQSALAAYIGETFCGDDDMTQPLCVKLFSNIGLDAERFNKTALPSILAHFPAGTSALTVFHYNTNFKTGSFQALDYGPEENNRRYDNATPPVYDLSNVKVNVSIWYARGDDIVNEKDVFELRDRLPNVISMRAVAYEKFNHFDFLWSQDVNRLVYAQL